jgi:hypothetical protein
MILINGIPFVTAGDIPYAVAAVAVCIASWLLWKRDRGKKRGLQTREQI